MSKKLVKKSRTDVLGQSASLRRASIRSPGQNEVFVGVQNLALYRYVYSSTLSFACVFILLASLLLQGFYVAQAEEIETAPTESISVSESSESEVATVESDVVETETDSQEKTVIDEVADLSLAESEINSQSSSEPEITSVGVGGELESGTENPTSTGSSSELQIDTATSTSEVSSSEQEGSEIISPNEGNVLESEVSAELAGTTTTDTIEATTTYESVSVTQSDDTHTFSKEDCTELADGSFYCKEINENELKDALFSARDQDGDLEIFLVREGKQAQITENSVDDASPYFDDISNTIVWQRLIDDRFQIIEYNLETGEEMQITDGTVNNMEPTRQGGYTVWQSWIGDSWNIVLYDGVTEKEVTHDTNHNIAPHIQGSLVIWNKTSVSGDKTIEMYNIDSGAYVTVNDPEGLAVDNPRMVLVYDSLHPNGDVVTKGFDIFTGEFIQLDTLPKSLPDIPDSETTTEVKALTQPKPELKLHLEDELPDDDFDNNVITDLDLSVDSEIATNTEMTLDLSQSTAAENILQEESEVIPDLVIPPFIESASSTGTTTSGV